MESASFSMSWSRTDTSVDDGRRCAAVDPRRVGSCGGAGCAGAGTVAAAVHALHCVGDERIQMLAYLTSMATAWPPLDGRET
eukprot:4234135-Pyramimonas_sp.AAC.1